MRGFWGRPGALVPGFDIKVLDPETGKVQPPGVAGSIAIKLPMLVNYWAAVFFLRMLVLCICVTALGQQHFAFLMFFF
jgi:hypothetical protein